MFHYVSGAPYQMWRGKLVSQPTGRNLAKGQPTRSSEKPSEELGQTQKFVPNPAKLEMDKMDSDSDHMPSRHLMGSTEVPPRGLPTLHLIRIRSSRAVKILRVGEISIPSIMVRKSCHRIQRVYLHPMCYRADTVNPLGQHVIFVTAGPF